MCGISFIIDKKGILDDQPISKMVQSQRHRGPDAHQFYQHVFPDQSQAFVGASRLRISENTDSADQPIFSSDRSSALVFNGEIYNFFDLKNELIRLGISFASNSDSEVLFQWIKTFGEKRIDELEGMFAFVYCDFSDGTVIAARDRFGMKPLHYSQNDHFLVFSSETRAIVSSGLVKKELNDRQIANYFNYKYAIPPATFYKDVYQLAPGSYLKYERGNLSQSQKYYCPEYSSSGLSVEEIKNDLIDSLYQQINSTRGVGLLLSGGVDSSLLLSLACHEGMKIPAYSIFSEDKSKEQRNASFLTKKLIADHRILSFTEEILNDFEKYVEKLDQPIADSAGLLTWKISEYASQDVKVLLSGAGADELFGGYNRHKAFQAYLEYKKLSLLLKKFSYPVFKKLLPERTQLYLHGLEKDEISTSQNFVTSHFSELRKFFASDYKPGLNTSDPLKNLLIDDLTNYLPNDVLAISDTTSMAVGLEMRMPYLTNAILSKVNSTEAGFLLSRGTKWILKEILSEHVPKGFPDIPKVGFGLPLTNWLADDKSNFLWRLFENKNSVIFNFLEQGIFRHLLSHHKGRKGNHAQELWSILTLGYWLQKEFD